MSVRIFLEANPARRHPLEDLPNCSLFLRFSHVRHGLLQVSTETDGWARWAPDSPQAWAYFSRSLLVEGLHRPSPTHSHRGLPLPHTGLFCPNCMRPVLVDLESSLLRAACPGPGLAPPASPSAPAVSDFLPDV